MFYFLHNSERIISYSIQILKYEHAAGNHNFTIAGTNNMWILTNSNQIFINHISTLYNVRLW
jgi:hypothetical protein